MADMALCTCGSGLRQIRCCSLDPAALPDSASLELLNPAAGEAAKLFNAKNLREAEAMVLKLLDLAPNQRLAIRVLYELRKAGNRHPATETLARRLAELPCDNAAQAAAANLTLAQLLIGKGRQAEAATPARAALKYSPRNTAAHQVMGVVFTETGETLQGEYHYRTAMALHDGDDGMILGNLAWNLKLQGRLDEAAQYYQRALAIRPDNRRATGGYAQVETARGDKAHAAALLDTALAQPPADRSLRLLRALLDLILNQPGAVLERLDDTLGTLLPAELIARGQALLRLGNPVDAIDLFNAARQLQRERFGQRYEAAPFIENAERYTRFFTADRLTALPRAAAGQTLQPVFLLGFPGSGTSLLEQLLAKIPGFGAADEFNPIAALLDLPELSKYPDCVTDFLIGDGQARLAAIRAGFLKNLASAGIITSEHRFVTLRASSNAWHLGLIKLLFPDAAIIHLLRHPFDISVTNFGRDHRLEGNCTVSLPAIAQHYALTMSMIRHYRGQLALRYLPIRYETLVADPGATLRAVLDFIGADVAIPSDPELRANRIGRNPRVPNHAVVQQPIHSRGVDHHLVFAAAVPDFFNPVRAILAPWIDELGYAE